jgi:hypothetical protein
MKKILVIVVLIISLLIGCPSVTEDQYDVPVVKRTEVEYRVTCSAAPYLVDITIENEDGGVSQFSDVVAPWSYSFTASKNDFVYVSAQNQQSSGTITASIYTDGNLFKTSTSSGAYVIATAYGSIP